MIVVTKISCCNCQKKIKNILQHICKKNNSNIWIKMDKKSKVERLNFFKTIQMDNLKQIIIYRIQYRKMGKEPIYFVRIEIKRFVLD